VTGKPFKIISQKNLENSLGKNGSTESLNVVILGTAHVSAKILWHVVPLLGNDRETNN
jgi:hypothetical protein